MRSLIRNLLIAALLSGAAPLAMAAPPVLNTQTGAKYTLVEGDCHQNDTGSVVFTKPEGATVTIPQLPLGCTVTLVQQGGPLTFVPGNSITLANINNVIAGTDAVNSRVDLFYTADGMVMLSGNTATPTAAVTAYYVAPNGNDANAGTLDAPFLTLNKCRNAMRGGSVKTCQLRGGNYVLPAAGLSLVTPDDDGQTWSYYPPDGLQSAALVGSSLATNTIMWVSTAKRLTVQGLTFKGSRYIYVYSQGNESRWLDNLLDGGGNNPWYGLDLYGDKLLIAGNTIQGLNGGSGNAIFINPTGMTNSVVRDNLLQCNSHYGMVFLQKTANNIVARNHILGIGHVGGPPPGCGPTANPSGTGVHVESDGGGNLFVLNTVEGVEGYDFVLSNGAAAGNFLDNNVMQTNTDPAVTLNGTPAVAIVHNTVNSPGSIGFNLGDEHDACPRPGTSNNLFIAQNSIHSQYEPLWLTATKGSVIQGNVGNIGMVTTGNPSPHWPTGIALVNWTAAGGCPFVQNSTGNKIQLNSFTSTDPKAKYGIYFDTSQTGNTVAWNIFYPYGTPGTAAIKNNAGGSQTLTANQTDADPAPLSAAPPLADAGGGMLAAPGQTVNLDGSDTRLIAGGASACVDITYAWSQIAGPAVTLTNADQAKASFTGPAVTQATILGFKLKATNANGTTEDRVYVGIDPSLTGVMAMSASSRRLHRNH